MTAAHQKALVAELLEHHERAGPSVLSEAAKASIEKHGSLHAAYKAERIALEGSTNWGIDHLPAELPKAPPSEP